VKRHCGRIDQEQVRCPCDIGGRPRRASFRSGLRGFLKGPRLNPMAWFKALLQVFVAKARVRLSSRAANSCSSRNQPR
jgi:hypothetical protein